MKKETSAYIRIRVFEISQRQPQVDSLAKRADQSAIASNICNTARDPFRSDVNGGTDW